MHRYGKRIAELRKKRGMNQETLAGLLGITRASLSHYETNRREPDYALLSRIADFFHVSLDYLIGRDASPISALSPHVSDFLNRVELADESVTERFELTIDGRTLTLEETKRFIDLIRAERALG
ncbi:helix-turn-helix domain-containing protein [Paenibacillus soyae]|uniref:Helix-turn-helix transcriptional regulator n=1 Tax=Paenibacillus soyae TaxID=2969249 RepID=A0A9X2SCS0_9BACL|nr:helix-turn-helix transcriptional regulator [Paenibacillus soyae]MCR2806437.1 helix-turn-helix transcriptional regulator [Paenibacillus soyae]